MTAQLTGVTSAEVVTLRAQNINGDGQPHGDVPFGFLTADVNGNRVVDRPDLQQIQTDRGPAGYAAATSATISISAVWWIGLTCNRSRPTGVTRFRNSRSCEFDPVKCSCFVRTSQLYRLLRTICGARFCDAIVDTGPIVRVGPSLVRRRLGTCAGFGATP